MKIILVAESAAEEARLEGEEREIQGVKEYLFFGNREDEDGNESEFHEWHGNHKYLLTNLQWFHELVNDERKATANASGNRMIKRSVLPNSNLETIAGAQKGNAIDFPQLEDAEEVNPGNITLDDE